MSQITLLSAATATNGVPSGATAGVALPHLTDRSILFAYGVCDSGQTFSTTLRLWGYNAELAKWFPLGTSSTAADKGKLNGGSAMGETDTDAMTHCEEVTALRRFSRLYCQVSAISGTGSTVTVVLDCIAASAVTQG